MKELDLLLERFVRGELPVADPRRRKTLARLLELPDPVLVDYLLGQGFPTETELAELVLRIRTSPPLTPAELAGANEERPGENGRPGQVDRGLRTVSPDGLPAAHVVGG
jgi:succinate dehydrogenase flavin-adding protein (antitoxin of CptAB toxin-antitoxin module)